MSHRLELLAAVALLVTGGCAPSEIPKPDARQVPRPFVPSTEKEPPPSSSGKDFYVSPTGDDANPGSAAEPWKTLKHAVSALRAGDRLFIGAGIYREPIEVVSSGSETPGPISFVAQDGGEVSIDGSEATSPYGFLALGKSHLRLQGLRFRNWKKAGIYISGHQRPDMWGDSAERVSNIELVDVVSEKNGSGGWAEVGILLKNVDRFVLRRVQANGNTSGGAHLRTSAWGWIVDSTFNDNTAGGYRDDSDGLVLSNSHSVRIERCEAVGNGEDGFDFPGDNRFPGQHVRDVHIYQSVAAWNFDDGFAASADRGENLFETFAITYVGSVSYANKAAGARIYSKAQDVRFVNNTLSHNGATGLSFQFESHDFGLRNNILAFNANKSLGTKDGAYGIRADHTLWFPDAPEPSLAGTNVLNEDPRFVDGHAGDLRLGEDSPARGAGAPVTRTTRAGAGTRVPVEESGFFQAGFWIVPGSPIVVGSNPPVRVVEIDESAATLVVDAELEWSAGEGVRFEFLTNPAQLGATFPGR